MKLGIVGLPNVGKSTLFNALTKAGADSANYPFCTIDPNLGVVEVPDPRLKVLQQMDGTDRIVPAVVSFYDIAGLVRGASKGEGLGNQFLSHIREVDAIVHLVRCFQDENVVHVDGQVDPARDIETIQLELILADIEIVERRIGRLERQAKGDKKAKASLEFAKRLLEHLENEKPAKTFNVAPDDKEVYRDFRLLTSKPTVYVANVSVDDIGQPDNPCVEQIRALAALEGAEVIAISAQIEQELSELDEADKQSFLDDLGLAEPGLNRLINASYRLLNLISFITSREVETRAWTITQGTKAQKAAGKIHTDIERGFIRAEVISYDALVKAGGYVQAKEKGLMRLEGRDYIVQDGDVIHFRFNV